MKGGFLAVLSLSTRVNLSGSKSQVECSVVEEPVSVQLDLSISERLLGVIPVPCFELFPCLGEAGCNRALGVVVPVVAQVSFAVLRSSVGSASC